MPLLGKSGELFYSSYPYHDKKSGKVYARVRYHDDAGNVQYKSRIIPKDVKGKKAQKAFAEAFRAELNAREQGAELPRLPHEDTRTVDEIVEKYLARQLEQGTLNKGSYYRQLSHYRKHISPTIGQYGFKSVDRLMVEELYTNLNNANLSQSTIYHYVKIVSKVYSFYVSLGEIPFNPFNQVPKAKKSKKARVTHLTQEQADLLFRAVYEDYDDFSRWDTIVHLLYYAGLRRGEICGLRWRDVNFKLREITVNTSVADTKGELYLKLPKGDKIRTIPMAQPLFEYLFALYNEDNPEPEWFVVGDKTKFFSIHVFTQEFRLFRERHDLKDAYDNAVIPHGIRHSFATSLVRSGGDISAIADILGHSDTDETLNTYADATQIGKRDAMLRFDALNRADSDNILHS